MLDENTQLLVHLIRCRRLVRRQSDKLSLWRELNSGDPNVIACDRRIVSLERERARLSAELAIVENAQEELQAPDAAQTRRVAELTEKVDALNVQQAAADALLDLSADVLKVAQTVKAAEGEEA